MSSAFVEKAAFRASALAHLHSSQPMATAFLVISACASSQQLADSASTYSHPADGYQQHQGA